MVGAAGISAFPMSARVIQRLGQQADPGNHLLMHAVGANVAGQIGSVLAGGILLAYLGYGDAVQWESILAVAAPVLGIGTAAATTGGDHYVGEHRAED